MSFFDDYVADGLCCQICGVFLDAGEPGHPRWCEGCAPDDAHPLLVVEGECLECGAYGHHMDDCPEMEPHTHRRVIDLMAALKKSLAEREPSQ